MKGELAKMTVTWRMAHFSAVMLGALQLPLKCARGDWNLKKGTPTATSSDPTEPRGFCLADIQGHVHTTWRVTIPLFGMVNIHGHTDVQGHCMLVHVFAEPAQDPQLPAFIMLAAMYGKLTQGPPRYQSA